MAHTREQKAAFIADVKAKLEQSETIYLTNSSGLTVEQVNDLRGRFRAAGVNYQVVKNTLLRLAMEDIGGFEELIGQLHGPTAVAFSEEPAAPARVIKKYLADHKIALPELKGAFVDGAVFQADALEALASLKSKDELIGDIIGLLLSPASNVVAALQAPGSTLAGAIKAIAEAEEA